MRVELETGILMLLLLLVIVALLVLADELSEVKCWMVRDMSLMAGVVLALVVMFAVAPAFWTSVVSTCAFSVYSLK